MKAIYSALACWLGCCHLLQAQEPGWVISGSGPHHRVWSKGDAQPKRKGQSAGPLHSYVELSSGLNYQNERGEWVPSVEAFELINGSAVARQSQLRAIFAANINSPGSALDVEAPDGKRFRTQILGLAYADDFGHAVLFAPLQDSVGQLVRPNELQYGSAFEGIAASVQYVLKRDGLSQNILLQETLPEPQDIDPQIDPKTCRLEVWTEFFDPPVPRKTGSLQDHAGLKLPNENLDFGAVHIGSGKAFLSVDENSPQLVSKSFVNIQNRTFLIESVGLDYARPALAKLPPRQAAIQKKPQKFLMAQVKAGNQPLPSRNPAQLKNKAVLTAKLQQARPSYTIDFETLITTTNMTFANSTYYISGAVNLSGVTTFEGGAVIKFAKTNSPQLKLLGHVVDSTTSFRPVVMTATDDQSIGEIIGTNALSGYYGLYALNFDGFATNVSPVLKNFRISYVQSPINMFSGTGYDFSHFQFINCQYVATSYYAESRFKNILVFNAERFFNGSGSSTTTSRVEHATFDTVGYLNVSGSTALLLTNSLLVAVTNDITFSGANNATNSSPTDTFQKVGAGAHYLTTNSAYRNVGTTNITASLLTEIRKRTTYPPLLVTNTISMDTTWTPVVMGDTDLPDLGWHYEPIDYLAVTLPITNATLTLTNGVAVAAWGQLAFWVQGSGYLVSEGSPASPNRIFSAQSVQEMATNYGNMSPGACRLATLSHSGSASNGFSTRFTSLSVMHGAGGTLDYFSTRNITMSLRDSEFYGGGLTLYTETNSRVAFTNNLFFRTGCSIYGYEDYQSLAAINNCFWKCSVDFEQFFTNGNWVVQNNVFDNTQLYDFGDVPVTADHNGFVNIDFSLWPHTNSTDILLTNFTYQTGTLGLFYQPTNSALIGKGFTNANYLGLYHYTCTTNQVKETNSVADIGLHYVATDSGGAALDGDSDGWPDYYEDTNGDGIMESGETDPADPNDQGLSVIITRPRNGSNIP
jgi:hypothetical protein